MVIEKIEQITKEWLQDILKKKGVLIEGAIEDLKIEFSPSTNAHIARLCLTYIPGSSGTLPASLVLKMCRNENGFVKDAEVNYYARDYVDLPDAPLPICYDAAHSTDGDFYHILMEDLSGTHDKDTQPSLEFGLATARALATLHSHGWGDTNISKLGGVMPGKKEIDAYIGHCTLGLRPMLTTVSADIDPASRAVIEKVFELYPAKLLERVKDSTGFTVYHGDLNPGNILFPRSGKGKVYFLDRQPFNWSLTTWLGAADLAYMMVQFWNPEERRALEMSILREYHAQLIVRGITDYSWEQLLGDYKLAALQVFYAAAEWCIKPEERERMNWLWRLELERALRAFSELSCDEVLN